MASMTASASPSQTPALVNVYIDGYNFYYSISRGDHHFLKLGWCNFRLLSERLVSKAFLGVAVGAVKYFTASVGNLEINPEEARRQRLWLEALMFGTGHSVQVIRGYHTRNDEKPRVEKQTDTNLAISMIGDALVPPSDNQNSSFSKKYCFSPCSKVLLISNDRDLIPAAEMLADYGKEVAVFHPVGTDEDRGRKGCPGISIHGIELEDLECSLLPDRIPRGDGTLIAWSDYLELKNASKRVTDQECLARCRAEAGNSDDPDTRVGCVIRHPKRGIVATGHNALPHGVERALPDRLSRPQKYVWMEHAERNAIYSAVRTGTRLDGCTMYVELMPCAECARAIIQSGIRHVVISQDRMRVYSNPAHAEGQAIAKTMLTEARIVLRAV